MNRSLAMVMLTALLSSGAAYAQDASTNASPNPPAVSTGHADSKTSAAPVPGKNSFTKRQAHKRFADHGYTAVKGLSKDDQGIWHGSAMKDGKPVNVTLDYQGNIAEQ
jgi:Spy/CpxP family protein refolding chaperone